MNSSYLSLIFLVAGIAFMAIGLIQMGRRHIGSARKPSWGFIFLGALLALTGALTATQFIF